MDSENDSLSSSEQFMLETIARLELQVTTLKQDFRSESARNDRL